MCATIDTDSPRPVCLNVGWTETLGIFDQGTRDPRVVRAGVVVDVDFLGQDHGVIVLSLLLLVPRLIFARVVTPVQREYRDATAVPLAIERIPLPFGVLMSILQFDV